MPLVVQMSSSRQSTPYENLPQLSGAEPGQNSEFQDNCSDANLSDIKELLTQLALITYDIIAIEFSMQAKNTKAA